MTQAAFWFPGLGQHWYRDNRIVGSHWCLGNVPLKILPAPDQELVFGRGGNIINPSTVSGSK